MPRLTLNNELLRAFLAVVERRSFTQAAVSLHRTQSAVSMQIKRLEQALDVRLFERDRPSLELTAAGTRLVDHARRMLELNDLAIAQVRQSESEERERVRMGVMEDVGHDVLPPALARVRATVPGVRVELQTGLTALMQDQLGQQFDLVIAMHPAGQGGGVLIRREQPVWATGPSCRIDPRDPIPLGLCPPECLLRTWAIEALEAANRPWHLTCVGQSAAAVNAMTAQGETITVVKSSLFPRTLRRISRHSGMPRLPPADIRLHRAPGLCGVASRLADQLTAELSGAVR